MIKINSTTYISFFYIDTQLAWAGWEVSEYLFGTVFVYKKSLLKNK